MHMISVFFADTVNTKARQTSTMASIIFASPCSDRETMQASSAYSVPTTARQTLFRVTYLMYMDYWESLTNRIHGSFSSRSTMRVWEILSYV